MMQFVNKSREDAREMTRREQTCLTFLMNAASALMEAKDDLAGRLTMIDGGKELMDTIADGCVKLLTEVRMTIPERQRNNLANTASDYEMRLVPKFTPTKTNVIIQKEEFRKLVDAAQVKCRDCVEDGTHCKACELYQLLTTILPLEAHDETMLCPYNLAEWEN